MNQVFIIVDNEGQVKVLFKDEAVNLIIVNTDRLEDYTFLHKGSEVAIDSVDEEDGTATLYNEDEDKFLHDVPVEELDVIDGEEYLDV